MSFLPHLPVLYFDLLMNFSFVILSRYYCIVWTVFTAHLSDLYNPGTEYIMFFIQFIDSFQ